MSLIKKQDSLIKEQQRQIDQLSLEIRDLKRWNDSPNPNLFQQIPDDNESDQEKMKQLALNFQNIKQQLINEKQNFFHFYKNVR